jgi:hypothetical protein
VPEVVEGRPSYSTKPARLQAVPQMELTGLEPVTSWVRSTDSPAGFPLERCRLAGSLRTDQCRAIAWMHVDYRRLPVIQALLAISA